LVEALAFDLAITDAVATPSTVFDLATIDEQGTPRTFDIGSLIYYTINFKNQGVTTATAVKLTGVIPSEKARVGWIRHQPPSTFNPKMVYDAQRYTLRELVRGERNIFILRVKRTKRINVVCPLLFH